MAVSLMQRYADEDPEMVATNVQSSCG
jgi:hypothetical protein